MGGGNSRLWNAQKTNNNICGTLVTENSILKTKLSTVNNKYNNIQNEVRVMKAGCANSGNVKNKANEIFNVLENQYQDKLKLISNQQDMIKKQDNMINTKQNKINNQQTEINHIKDKIQTLNRKNHYKYIDINHINNIKSRLKIFLLIVFIILIIILVYKIKNNL